MTRRLRLRSFVPLAIGVALMFAGFLVEQFRLVDPISDERFLIGGDVQFSGLLTPSTVVGFAVAALGLAVVAAWVGAVIVRRPRDDDAVPAPRSDGVRRTVVGVLLLVVGALVLSLQSIGGVWSQIWASDGRGWIPYSVFQYLPVAATFGMLVLLAGLVLALTGLRTITRARDREDGAAE